MWCQHVFTTISPVNPRASIVSYTGRVIVHNLKLDKTLMTFVQARAPWLLTLSGQPLGYQPPMAFAQASQAHSINQIRN